MLTTRKDKRHTNLRSYISFYFEARKEIDAKNLTSVEEIKYFIQISKNKKAPGKDGIPQILRKKAWLCKINFARFSPVS